MKTLTGKEILGCPNLFGRSALREVHSGSSAAATLIKMRQCLLAIGDSSESAARPAHQRQSHSILEARERDPDRAMTKPITAPRAATLAMYAQGFL